MGVEEAGSEDPDSDKASVHGLVRIESYTERTDRVTLRIWPDFDIESELFLEFLKEASDSFVNR